MDSKAALRALGSAWVVGLAVLVVGAVLAYNVGGLTDFNVPPHLKAEYARCPHLTSLRMFLGKTCDAAWSTMVSLIVTSVMTSAMGVGG
jgi:hypothetical protein